MQGVVALGPHGAGFYLAWLPRATTGPSARDAAHGGAITGTFRVLPGRRYAVATTSRAGASPCSAPSSPDVIAGGALGTIAGGMWHARALLFPGIGCLVAGALYYGWIGRHRADWPFERLDDEKRRWVRQERRAAAA